MNLSENGLNFIKAHEGFSAEVYKDSGGLPTIGYGHLIKPGETFTTPMDQQTALGILARDVAWAVGKVNLEIYDPLHNINQNEFDALVSFCFNIGPTAFEDSTLLKNLNSGNFAGAAEQFLRWVHVGKSLYPNPGLVNRREAERALFMTPIS
jgi:lysozyme